VGTGLKGRHFCRNKMLPVFAHEDLRGRGKKLYSQIL
jgi:hypothetical protein